MILKLCTPCCLKWLRMMKLPTQMMKSPLRSLFQKILIAKPILTHKIGTHLTFIDNKIITYYSLYLIGERYKDRGSTNCRPSRNCSIHSLELPHDLSKSPTNSLIVGREKNPLKIIRHVYRLPYLRTQILLILIFCRRRR